MPYCPEIPANNVHFVHERDSGWGRIRTLFYFMYTYSLVSNAKPRGQSSDFAHIYFFSGHVNHRLSNNKKREGKEHLVLTNCENHLSSLQKQNIHPQQHQEPLLFNIMSLRTVVQRTANMAGRRFASTTATLPKPPVPVSSITHS